MSVIRIIQISDTHLLADPEGELLGVKTEQSFLAVINEIKRRNLKADLIINSGDISQDTSESSYIRHADHISTLNLPVYCVAGNHDDPAQMAAIYPYANARCDTQLIIGNWQFIFLNSHKPKAVEGCLSASQLNYLTQCLETHPNHYSIIVFHHHPMSVGSAWLDRLGLTNAAEFWNVVANYSNVNTILFGHIHQEYQQVVNGIHCYATPSTCIQFKRNHAKFALDLAPPGYRLIELHDDGSLETSIERIANYIGVFEKDAKGY